MTNTVYTKAQKKNVVSHLRWMLAQFGTAGVAKITGISASIISNAVHTSHTRTSRSRPDCIGRLFVQRLAAALGLDESSVVNEPAPAAEKAAEKARASEERRRVRIGRKSVESRVAKGALFSLDQKKHIDEAFRRISKERGLTAKEVSRRMGLHQNGVTGRLSKLQFGHAFVRNLAKVLGVSPEDLTGVC